MYKLEDLLENGKLAQIINKKNLAKKRKNRTIFWVTIGAVAVAAVIMVILYKKKTKENYEDFEDCFDDEDFDDCFEEEFFED